MIALDPDSWVNLIRQALGIEKERHPWLPSTFLAISAGGSSNMRRFRRDMQIYMHFQSTIGQGPSVVASSSSVPQSPPLYVSVSFFFQEKKCQGNPGLNRKERIARFRRLLKVLPAIMLFRYGVVLNSWALLNLWSSSAVVFDLMCSSNFERGPIISTWS
jgi:hypothetical protein